MRKVIGWRSAVAAAALWILFLSPTRLGAQQAGTGVIEGRITETASGRPLDNVQVTIVGTNLGGATNETGAYRITGAPARQVELRARRIGYGPASQSVVVVAGQSTSADFRLQVSRSPNPEARRPRSAGGSRRCHAVRRSYSAPTRSSIPSSHARPVS